MADAGEDPVDALFEKLSNHVKNGQHKRVVKTADEVLALKPGDPDALRCKIIALMQLDDYEGAVASIQKGSLASDMQFEKAYCLYRLGRITEGLDALRAVPADEDPQATLQLRAQLHYRLGQHRECITAYDELFQKHKADSLELKTNVIAAYVAAQLSHEIPDIMQAMKVTSKSSFEVGFNRACGLVDVGEYAAAETELRLAMKLGRETLFEEEASPEEVEEELAPMTAQMAYVLGRLGRHEEAAELYDKVTGNRGLSDEVTLAVAHSNAAAEAWRVVPAAPNRKKAGSGAKKLDALVDADKVPALKLLPTLEARLSAAQKRTLHMNRAALHLISGRMEGARDAVAALARGYGEADPDVVLLRAAVLVADGKPADAERLLEQFCAAPPPAPAPGAPAPTARPAHALLLRAQLALEAAAPQRALQLLAAAAEADAGLATAGAMVATRAALHQQLGDPAGAQSLLEGTLKHWQRLQQAKGAPPAPAGSIVPSATPEQAASAVGWCLQALVTLQLRMGRVDEALALYRQMSAPGKAAGGPTSSMVGVLSRLLRSVAASDPSAAPALAGKDLPAPSAAELRGLDPDALEDLAAAAARAARAGRGAAEPLPALGAGAEAGKAGAGGTLGKRGAGERMDVDGEQPKKKRAKRKRKPRLPKGYNPELPNGGLPLPDPDRWRPKRERSDYKKKSKRRRDLGKGAQGSGKVNENLDRSNAPLEPKDPKQGAKPMLPPRKGKGKR